MIPLVLVALAASSTKAQLEDPSNSVTGGFSVFGPDSELGSNLKWVQQGVKNVLGGVVGVDGKHSNCLQKIICKVRQKGVLRNILDENSYET